MAITIKEVKSRRDLKRFVDFPYRLYRASEYWVPPLRFDELNTLDKEKNPAFDYCEASYWLAWQDDEVVGRIAGIINHEYIAKWQNKYARFGWLDFINDDGVLKALLETVEAWARDLGMTAIQGPLGFTDFDPEGMLVDGFEIMGTMSTIYNHEYYPPCLEKYMYKKDAEWIEYEIAIPASVPLKMKSAGEAIKSRYHLHMLEVSSTKEIRPYARQLFELLNQTYKDLYGVVTLSQKQIDAYTKQYFSFIDKDYVSIVLDADNKMVAFAITMPSLSLALRKAGGSLFPFGFFYLYNALKKNDTADLYLIAIDTRLQGKGINVLLISDLVQKFNRNKIGRAITHPMLETNTKMLAFWKQFDKRELKRRRCYIKVLA